MKKLLCTSLALLLVLGGISVAFAAETPSTTVAVASTGNATSAAVTATSDSSVTIVPDMTFTGTPIKLSLQDAYKKILSDSPGKMEADYNKKQALSISRGYFEEVKSINDGSAMVTSKAYKEVQRALRDYAAKQADPNYQAEINKLKMDTLTNYYQLKQLEDLERIAKETLTLKEKLLSNTQLKYKLGTVSNSDVLQAQSAMNKAQDELFTAQNNLRNKKMAFNIFMGYDLMQNVTLTDSLKQVDLPAKTLTNSIKDALANRNEIKGAAFNLEYSKLFFKVYEDYPENSASYLKRDVAVKLGEKAYKDSFAQIELDVRSKYMDMQQKYAAINTGKKTVENAKEGLRLAQLQYDAGMATLTNVNEAQIAYNQSEVALANNMLDYNLAVEAYNYASGVGTAAATIQ